MTYAFYNFLWKLIDYFLKTIIIDLKDENKIKLSKFGTFELRKKKSRIGRNPKTGIEAPIIARKVVTFKPSQIMKDKINKGNQKR